MRVLDNIAALKGGPENEPRPALQGRRRKGKLKRLLSRLKGRRVLVVGDLCLDEYIVGRAQRLSREAPVPILEFERRFTVPGAAANPALNIAALGGQALMAGVVGDDEAGRALRQALAEQGIDIQGVVVDPSRQTTVKTRVLAEVSLLFPQQLVRVDRQERRPLEGAILERLIPWLTEQAPGVEAVLLSDYRSGVIQPKVVEAVAGMARAHRLVATVDSQGDLFKFRRFTVVKCNRQEAEASLGRPLASEADFVQGGQLLRRRLGARAVIITRGAEGMSVVGPGAGYLHIPAANRSEVFDVTGAGDTVIAVLTLALAAGARVAEAAHLANLAAGLVVRKLGNATVTPEELEQAVEMGRRWAAPALE